MSDRPFCPRCVNERHLQHECPKNLRERTVRDRLAAWPNDAWDQDFRDFIDNEVLPELAARAPSASDNAVERLDGPLCARCDQPYSDHQRTKDVGGICPTERYGFYTPVTVALSDQPTAVVSDAMVEAHAEWLFEKFAPTSHNWRGADERQKERWRGYAREALEAAMLSRETPRVSD